LAEADPIGATGLVEGCGWVRSDAPHLEIDHHRRCIAGLQTPVYLPFWSAASSSGDMQIVRDDSLNTQLIDTFRAADTAALKKRGWAVQNMSDSFQLDSMFEKGSRHAAAHCSHLNRASWDLEVPEGTRGLIIRKEYDQFHGRQRARVFVSGKLVGWWYEPREDRRNRWAISDFLISGQHLPASGTARIEIDPPSGSPLWDVGRISVFSIQAK
jgi:hypothetical protein